MKNNLEPFLGKVSPEFGGEATRIPLPEGSPEERQLRRLAHRNERHLFYRACNSSGKRVVSQYPPDSPLTVYEQSVWWGDSWEALQFGREFDFSKPFFEQYQQLRLEVPRMNVLQSRNENADFTNCVSHLKDCYLMFSSDYNRDCMYGTWIEKCRDCVDNLMITSCELCYECIYSRNCYNCRYVLLSSQCHDSRFLFDCRGCSDCFLCAGLRNKKYCIENRQYTKEEYQERLAAVDFGSHQVTEQLKKRFGVLVAQTVRRPMWCHGRVLRSSGDLLSDVENCQMCFELAGAKDCGFVQAGFDLKDTWESSYVMGELGYQNCECVPQPFQSAFNLNCYSGTALYYSDMCMNSCAHLFGCVGLKHKSYCILNRQYSKEAYQALVPRIIEHMRLTGEWGEFLPERYSLFGYNLTNAMEEHPLDRAVVLARGWNWYDAPDAPPMAAELTPPDSIEQATNEVVQQVFCCTVSKKPYRITSQELAFYRKLQIPLPQCAPEERHRMRMKHKNPRRLFERICNKTGETLITSYGPERSEQVYSEQAYQQERY